MRIRETNANEPLLTRRKVKGAVETKVVLIFWDKLAGNLITEASGSRRVGGVNLIQDSVWNCGNQFCDVKGIGQVEIPQDL